MAEAKLYGQNKGGMSINGIIKDYYAYAGEKISAGDLVEYVNGIAGKKDYGASVDTAIDNTNAYTGYVISAVQLDENRVFIAHSYSSNYHLYGVVCTINGATITYGTDTQLSSTKNAGLAISACLLPNGNVFIAHCYSTNYNLYGMVCTVNGTTITAGTDTQLVTQNETGQTISVCLLPNGNVFIAHIYASNCYLYGVVVSIDGTTISKGSDTKLNGSVANAGLLISTCLLPNGNVFIAHSYNTNKYLYGMVVSINGTTVTKAIGDIGIDKGAAVQTISICLLTSGNVFVAYGRGNSYYMYGIVVTINDSTITAGSYTQLSTNGARAGISTQQLPNGDVLMVRSGDTTHHLYNMVIRIDGTTITKGTDALMNSTDYSGYAISSFFLPNGTLFIAHSNSSSYYLNAQVFGIDENTNLPINNIVATEYETQVRKVTTGQFDGIAKTSGEGGDDTGHKDMVSIWTLAEMPKQEFLSADGNTIADANGDIFLVREG